MKSAIFRTLAAVVAVAVLTTLPAFAGVTYEFEVTDVKRGKTEMTKLQAEESNLRMEIADRGRKNPGGAVIFQGDRREGKEPRLILIDGEGGHMIVNQAKVEQLISQIPAGAPGAENPVVDEAMIERMRSQIDLIQDPEARARALEQFEQRFGSTEGEAKKPEVEYVERGVRDRAGYPAVRYDVMRDGVKVAEVWATDWVNIEGGREARKAFAGLQEFYRGLEEELAKLSQGGALILGGEEGPFERIFDLDRFPVEMHQYEGGQVVRSTVLKSAARADHDASVFRPADGSVERQFGGR